MGTSGTADPQGPRDATARGQVVARLLRGSWRTESPAPNLSSEELASIVPILARQASAGLAWARIRGTSLEEAPGAEALHDGFRHHTLHVRLLEKGLAEAVQFFRAQGVEVALAKGWAVGRLYPEPGRRMYGDLDFLVEPEQLAAAEEALRSPNVPKVAIELHGAFNELEDRRTAEVMGRAEAEDLGGVEIRILAPEDHLRLLALHALEHGLARPLWLCDLGAFLENLPEGFDWDLARWGDPWLSEGVRCALGLARELLAVDLEGAGVPAPWRDPPLPSWLGPAALKAFGAEAHYMDHADFGAVVRRPAQLLRAARLRWANPIEATFRREAPWDDSPRFPVQLADYLVRGFGFLGDVPGYLSRPEPTSENLKEPQET